MKVFGGRDNTSNIILNALMLVIIVVFVAVLAFIITDPYKEKLTEFYLAPDVNQYKMSYPTELPVGEKGNVKVGIINREQEAITYYVEVLISGESQQRSEAIVLGNDEKWEETFIFLPDQAGEEQKVEFLLFKNEGNDVYRSLYLWVNVIR
jgi:uncharacterized membrane protein